MSAASKARELFARRDQLARELAAVDHQLNRLRADYMRETSVYGIHPEAFRRAVETVNLRVA